MKASLRPFAHLALGAWFLIFSGLTALGLVFLTAGSPLSGLLGALCLAGALTFPAGLISACLS